MRLSALAAVALLVLVAAPAPSRAASANTIVAHFIDYETSCGHAFLSVDSGLDDDTVKGRSDNPHRYWIDGNLDMGASTCTIFRGQVQQGGAGNDATTMSVWEPTPVLKVLAPQFDYQVHSHDFFSSTDPLMPTINGLANQLPVLGETSVVGRPVFMRRGDYSAPTYTNFIMDPGFPNRYMGYQGIGNPSIMNAYYLSSGSPAGGETTNPLSPAGGVTPSDLYNPGNSVMYPTFTATEGLAIMRSNSAHNIQGYINVTRTDRDEVELHVSVVIAGETGATSHTIYLHEFGDITGNSTYRNGDGGVNAPETTLLVPTEALIGSTITMLGPASVSASEGVIDTTFTVSGVSLGGTTDNFMLGRAVTIQKSGQVQSVGVVGLVEEAARQPAFAAGCDFVRAGSEAVGGSIELHYVEGQTLVVATVDLSGLSSIDSEYYLAIHETGDHSLASASTMFNPFSSAHGDPFINSEHEVGAIGEIEVSSIGGGHFSRWSDRIKLTGSLSVVGRTVAIHANAEDNSPGFALGSIVGHCTIGVLSHARYARDSWLTQANNGAVASHLVTGAVAQLYSDSDQTPNGAFSTTTTTTAIGMFDTSTASCSDCAASTSYNVDILAGAIVPPDGFDFTTDTMGSSNEGSLGSVSVDASKDFPATLSVAGAASDLRTVEPNLAQLSRLGRLGILGRGLVVRDGSTDRMAFGVFGIAGEAAMPTTMEVGVCTIPDDGAGGVYGRVYFYRDDQLAGFRVIGDLYRLPGTQHGMSIRSTGDLEAVDPGSSVILDNNDESGTRSVNPDTATRHAGDLGNLNVDGLGYGHVNVFVPDTDSMAATVAQTYLSGDQSIIGRAFAVHTNPDSGATDQLNGNMGPALGACVIGVAEADTPYLPPLSAVTSSPPSTCGVITQAKCFMRNIGAGAALDALSMSAEISATWVLRQDDTNFFGYTKDLLSADSAARALTTQRHGDMSVFDTDTSARLVFAPPTSNINYDTPGNRVGDFGDEMLSSDVDRVLDRPFANEDDPSLCNGRSILGRALVFHANDASGFVPLADGATQHGIAACVWGVSSTAPQMVAGVSDISIVDVTPTSANRGQKITVELDNTPSGASISCVIKYGATEEENSAQFFGSRFNCTIPMIPSSSEDILAQVGMRFRGSSFVNPDPKDTVNMRNVTVLANGGSTPGDDDDNDDDDDEPKDDKTSDDLVPTELQSPVLSGIVVFGGLVIAGMYAIGAHQAKANEHAKWEMRAQREDSSKKVHMNAQEAHARMQNPLDGPPPPPPV